MMTIYIMWHAQRHCCRVHPLWWPQCFVPEKWNFAWTQLPCTLSLLSWWNCITMIEHWFHIPAETETVTIIFHKKMPAMMHALAILLTLCRQTQADSDRSRHLSSDDFARGGAIVRYTLPWWHPEIQSVAMNRVSRRFTLYSYIHPLHPIELERVERGV